MAVVCRDLQSNLLRHIGRLHSGILINYGNRQSEPAKAVEDKNIDVLICC